MKNLFTLPVFAIILIAFLSSCKKDNPISNPISNPDGTVSVTLNGLANLILYEGIDPNPYRVGYQYLNFQFGMTQSSLSCQSTINTCPTAVSDFRCGQLYAKIDVANIGEVGGLGYVTSKPNSGYSPVSQIQKGHGYVIRYKKTHDQTDQTYPYFYARFYVVDWLTSATSGGVIGATVNYQNPF